MSEHTPGPWKIHRGKHNRDYLAIIDSIPDKDGKVVANCICHVAMTNDDRTANANLIAAAPELADALRELHKWSQLNSVHYSKSSAAFNKAAELLRRIGK